MFGQPIGKRGGHLGIAEHDGPFAKVDVGGDDDAGALVEEHEVGVRKPAGDLPCLALGRLLFEGIA